MMGLPPRFPLLYPALAVLVGILAAAVLHAIVWGALVLLASAALYFLSDRGRRWTWIALLLVLLASISALRQHGHRHHQERQQASLQSQLGERQQLTGTVRANSGGKFPHWVELRTQLDSNDPQLDLRIELPEPPPPEWVVGTQLQARGTLRAAKPARNPGQWDPQRFLHSRGVSGLMYTRTMPLLVGEARWWSPRANAARLRHHLLEHLDTHGSDKVTTSIMQGVLLGERSGFPAQTLEDFRFSGTLHLFAVSGLHVGMVGAFIWFIFRFAGCSRRQAILILVPAVWCYTLLAGSTPSSVRAATMMTFFLVGPLIDRRAYAINSLAAAFLLLVWINPGQLQRIGFQLTFGVVAALLTAGTLLRKTWQRHVRVDPFYPANLVPESERRRVRLKKGFLGALTTSVAATMGAMPLSLWHFNLGSPVAIPLNLVLIPLAGLVLLLGFAGIAIGLVATPLATLSLKPAAWTCALMAWISHQGAAMPYGHFHLHRPPPADCEIIVFDMDWGGGSTLVRHRHAAPWLIDTGSARGARSIVLRALSHYGEPAPSHLWLSHRDAQHIGGKALFASRFPELEITPDHPSGGAGFHPQTILASQRQTSIRVLFPPPQWAAGRANDRCLVFLIESGAMRILVLNDAGFLPQAWLMENLAEEIRCDVLVSGWANDDIALTRTFVDATGARLVVLPRPYHRSYHQPDEAFRESLAAPGREIWSQSSTGAVYLRVHQDAIEAKSHLDDSRLRLPQSQIE